MSYNTTGSVHAIDGYAKDAATLLDNNGKPVVKKRDPIGFCATPPPPPRERK